MTLTGARADGTVERTLYGASTQRVVKTYVDPERGAPLLDSLEGGQT